jgi:hypothetical protein|tara:strand:- start:91 stop:360 length:270 start_codon:yes stop_codon:yes gene_type:complete
MQLKLHAAAAVGAAAAASAAMTKGRLPSLLVNATTGVAIQPPLLAGKSADIASGMEDDGSGSGSPSGIVEVDGLAASILAGAPAAVQVA